MNKYPDIPLRMIPLIYNKLRNNNHLLFHPLVFNSFYLTSLCKRVYWCEYRQKILKVRALFHYFVVFVKSNENEITY